MKYLYSRHKRIIIFDNFQTTSSISNALKHRPPMSPRNIALQLRQRELEPLRGPKLLQQKRAMYTTIAQPNTTLHHIHSPVSVYKRFSPDGKVLWFFGIADSA
jgi:hypothetical protein